MGWVRTDEQLPKPFTHVRMMVNDDLYDGWWTGKEWHVWGGFKGRSLVPRESFECWRHE